MVDARIIIVTLGLAEGWVHGPSGLAVNAINGRILKRIPNDFEFHKIDYPDIITSLDKILDLILQVHSNGDFQLFITVSPVPFASTFSAEDVIQANMTSKSTLRAAAAAFCAAHENVHYFPSYELVLYTEPALAWRPDRIHVDPLMVRHIMDHFIRAVYQTEELPV